MSYQRQTFVDNQTVLTARMMDHIEDGIVANEQADEMLAPAYSTTGTYEYGTMVTYDGKLYRCTWPLEPISGEDWDPDKWEEVTIESLLNEIDENYAEKYAIAEVFDDTSPFYEGDIVWYGQSLWRFITDHSAGEWDEEEVEPLTVTGELQKLNGVVRFDDAQTLTTGQKAQARTNIGAASAGDIPTGVVRFDEAQTLTEAQKQQARTNIGAGTGGGGSEGAVRYDEAQSLTSTQKTTARGNISAATLIPTGTAFSQAVQDGTTYDVQDTVARAEADIANLSGIDLTGFGGISASKTLVGYTYNRTANRVTINGSGTTTTNVQVCITGATGITNQNNDDTHPDKLVNANAVLLAGHVYSLSARYVSGTVTKTGSNNFNICWFIKYGTDAVTRSNFTTDMYSDFSGGKVEWRTSIAPNVNAALGFGFYQRTGYTFSDFVLEYNVEDITDKLRTVTLGTAETRVASRDYAKDEFVLYLGRLYTARSAITAGTAFSTGTSSGNITSVSLLDYIADPSITVTDTAPTITALTGRRYICSATAVTQLIFTPCSTGICSVRFTSGTTATVLTLPQTVVMPEWWSGVEANRTYEISIEDGVYGVVTSWA